MLVETPDLLSKEEVRRDLAVAAGVVVGPRDANPWDLRVSCRSDDWGVRTRNIQGSVERVGSVLGCQDLVLEIINFDTIAFRLYEDTVIELARTGAVVGISFDYPELTGREKSIEGGTRPGRHVVRLSPSVIEKNRTPNILSPEFKFDYAESLWIFDDTGEMRGSECFVSWPRLIRAGWEAGGGLWAVRRQTAASTLRTEEVTTSNEETGGRSA